MNTVKLMVVNVARERERNLIGCVFDAVEVREPATCAATPSILSAGGKARLPVRRQRGWLNLRQYPAD